MPRLCCRARHMTPCARKVATGEKVSQRLWSKKGGRRDRLDGKAQSTERPEERRVFELERVVSCRNADLWWRTKLDFGSGEPFDDLHRSTAFRAAPENRESLRWKRRVVRLAAVVPNPTTESKAAGAWRVCGWPGSRSYGCARSLSEGCAVRSDTGTRRPIEAATSVCCDERNHASEK